MKEEGGRKYHHLSYSDMTPEDTKEVLLLLRDLHRIENKISRLIRKYNLDVDVQDLIDETRKPPDGQS